MLVPCIWLISDCFDQSRLILPIRCVLLEDSLPPTGRFLLSFVKPIKTNLSQLPSLQWKPRSVWPSGILISFFTSCEAVMVSWCHDISYVHVEHCGTQRHHSAPSRPALSPAKGDLFLQHCNALRCPAMTTMTAMPAMCIVLISHYILNYSIMWKISGETIRKLQSHMASRQMHVTSHVACRKPPPRPDHPPLPPFHPGRCQEHPKASKSHLGSNLINIYQHIKNDQTW